MTEARALTPQPDPLPGLHRLRRRLGDRDGLRDDLLARLAGTPDPSAPGGVLGGRLDVAGDPTLVTVAELWARVADGVGAYTELTAGEAYLGTAQDWTDVRRITDLVGYRPARRAAAQGWLRADLAAGASPLLPAGTRVASTAAAPTTPQTFEVGEDTALRADWAGLTVTGVPVPAAPTGRQLRFLGDPGFAASDRIVLVAESGAPPYPTTWQEWLAWLVALLSNTTYVGATGQTVRGVVRVTKRTDDLGATLLEVDRELGDLLPASPGTSYAAYRVRAELTLPSRLDALSYVGSDGKAASTTPTYPAGEPALPYGSTFILVNDASAVSLKQQLVLHAGATGACLVTTVASVAPLDWHVSPGTVKRVARVDFDNALPSTLQGPGLAVLLTDGRQVAQHYELPALSPGATMCRVHPRPAVLPERIAIGTQGPDGTTMWELTRCGLAAQDTTADPGGVQLSLADARGGAADRGPTTGNVARIHHGATSTATLTVTGGVAVVAGPVTGDVAADGTVTDSLVVTVGGVRWDEVDSLYGRGPGDLVYATRPVADGRLVISFGDGTTGALPRGDVQAHWRVGGGLVGEVDGARIVTLLGSVNGVQRVAGVGRTFGAADPEEADGMRRGAAARIRALDRVVALGDLADLALTVPGTSHAAAWRGTGPPGCPCGGSGLHVAALRLTALGVRPPQPAELTALSGYLDARRDVTVPLCVCAAVATPVVAAAAVAVDPRRDPAVVLAAARTAVLDPAGPLAPVPRDLGVPLDGSDVIEIVQPVTGVVGLTGLTLTGATRPLAPGDLSLGRLSAARYELLWVADTALRVRSDG